jgi:hypothetical protein
VKRKKPKDKRNTPPKRKTIPKATRRGYNSGYSKEEAERIRKGIPMVKGTLLLIAQRESQETRSSPFGREEQKKEKKSKKKGEANPP